MELLNKYNDFLKELTLEEQQDQIILLLNSYLMFVVGQGQIQNLATPDGIGCLCMKFENVANYLNEYGELATLYQLDQERERAKKRIEQRAQ